MRMLLFVYSTKKKALYMVFQVLKTALKEAVIGSSVVGFVLILTPLYDMIYLVVKTKDKLTYTIKNPTTIEEKIAWFNKKPNFLENIVYNDHFEILAFFTSFLYVFFIIPLMFMLSNFTPFYMVLLVISAMFSSLTFCGIFIGRLIEGILNEEQF